MQKRKDSARKLINRAIKKAGKFFKNKPKLQEEKVIVYDVITPETISEEALAFVKVFGKAKSNFL